MLRVILSGTSPKTWLCLRQSVEDGEKEVGLFSLLLLKKKGSWGIPLCSSSSVVPPPAYWRLVLDFLPDPLLQMIQV